MARLPPLEISALLARDELHRGNREKALAILAEAGDGPIARQLRAAVSRRGRQPFGAKHRWWNIGVDNDEMREAGFSYEERLDRLSTKYRIGDQSKLKTAIAKYERAAAEIRDFEEENR